MSFPIKVADSPCHGQGIFAARDIAEGEVVERCPYLVIDRTDLSEGWSRLDDYVFSSPDDEDDYLCVLGYGMVYNHSAEPNVEWEIDDDDDQFVTFIALRDISQGEELFQDYGEDYWVARGGIGSRPEDKG